MSSETSVDHCSLVGCGGRCSRRCISNGGRVTTRHNCIMQGNVRYVCEEVEVFDTYVNKLVQAPTSY